MDSQLKITSSSTRSGVFQDSLDELEMDDYWKEVENISRSGGGEGGGGAGRGEGAGETQEEEQQKIPEGRIHCVQGLG